MDLYQDAFLFDLDCFSGNSAQNCSQGKSIYFAEHLRMVASGLLYITG